MGSQVLALFISVDIICSETDSRYVAPTLDLTVTHAGLELTSLLSQSLEH